MMQKLQISQPRTIQQLMFQSLLRYYTHNELLYTARWGGGGGGGGGGGAPLAHLSPQAQHIVGGGGTFGSPLPTSTAHSGGGGGGGLLAHLSPSAQHTASTEHHQSGGSHRSHTSSPICTAKGGDPTNRRYKATPINTLQGQHTCSELLW